MKPVKHLVQETIIVLFCSIVSTFIYFSIDSKIAEFFSVVTNSKIVDTNATQIFTDEPGF